MSLYAYPITAEEKTESKVLNFKVQYPHITTPRARPKKRRSPQPLSTEKPNIMNYGTPTTTQTEGHTAHI
jgi:hypothetical protein